MRPELEKMLMSLTTSERKEVQTYLSYRASTKSQTEMSNHEQWVWESLVNCMRAKGIRAVPAVPFLAKFGRDNFKGCVGDYDAIIDTGTGKGPRLSNIQRRVLYDILNENLANLLPGLFPPVDITINNMLNSTHHLYHAVDIAFPGYIQAGTLGIIVTQRPNDE